MVYLITLNPAIDKYVYVDSFEKSITNFSYAKHSIFGGKAINVGKIVNEFIDDYEIITTINLENKNFIMEETKNLNVKFFEVDHIRENIKINNNSEITEINERVEQVQKSVINEIFDYLLTTVQDNDIVLFAGSVHPANVLEITNLCQKLNKAKVIIDSASFTLEDLEQVKPYMLKPNDEEIQKLFDNNIDYKVGAQKLVDLGVSNVIISLGGDGSYYKSKDQQFIVSGIKGNVINTVGAGDSYVGGFIVGLCQNMSIEDTLKLASACGSATAFLESIAKREDIDKLVSNVKISK